MENFFRRAEKKLHSQGKGWEGGKGTGENAKKRNKYLQSEKRNTSVFVVCVTWLASTVVQPTTKDTGNKSGMMPSKVTESGPSVLQSFS